MSETLNLDEASGTSSINPVDHDLLRGLIRQVVTRFFDSRPGMQNLMCREDVEQELWFVAQVAHVSFDPDLGVAYTTHLKFRMDKAVLDLMRKADAVPTHVRADWNRITRTLETLGVDAPLSAMADKAGIDYERALSVVSTVHASQLVSLDVDAGHYDIEQQVDYDPDEYVLAVEQNAAVRMAVDMLPPRHREVLIRRTLECEPIDTVADVLGVSKGRVSQIHSEAISRIRDAIQDLITADLAAELGGNTPTR